MNALCLLSGRCLTSPFPPPAPGLPRGTQAGAAETPAEPQDAVRRGFTDTGGQSCTVSAVAGDTSAPAVSVLCNRLHVCIM